jgi:muramoyltetrapeptide carboxypeptidase
MPSPKNIPETTASKPAPRIAPAPGAPRRIHLIAHAGSAAKDVRKFGFADAAELFAEIRHHLPRPYRLTGSTRFFEVAVDENRAGRRDDTARVRDLQAAIDDPRTLAIVAANGGAYFSRILPRLDFSGLAERREPLWTLGFSEMTTLVNIIASYRCGRGLYWLCPNYMAWKIRPAQAARAAHAEFWTNLPAILAGEAPADLEYLNLAPVRGRLVSGRVESGTARIVGGCLSVFVAMLTDKLGRGIRPDGRWLAIEDINEPPYRIDRYLAALQIAGWFDRVEGVLVGDVHTGDDDQRQAVIELLKFHVAAARKLPIVLTGDFGHTWPIVALPINRPMRLTARGRNVEFAASEG